MQLSRFDGINFFIYCVITQGTKPTNVPLHAWGAQPLKGRIILELGIAMAATVLCVDAVSRPAVQTTTAAELRAETAVSHTALTPPPPRRNCSNSSVLLAAVRTAGNTLNAQWRIHQYDVYLLIDFRVRFNVA